MSHIFSMRAVVALAVQAAMLGSPTVGAAPPAPTAEVATTNGVVRGEHRPEGDIVFRSIPYAAPPTGEARWRAPRLPAAWQGAHDARARAPSCPQPLSEGSDQIVSEDCLYLAVATPSLEPGNALPVLVWIHGGNNIGGRGAWGVDGTFQHRGLVVVSLQFRLGALGFLSHPSLSAEAGGASGNYALMDQQLALRWVRDNIARFGGDPGNVTIMGHSTGGQNVMLHMQAAGSRGLFHKAIVLSANTNFETRTRTLAEAEQQGRLIARAAGLDEDASSAALRSLPVERLLAAQSEAPVFGYDNPWLTFLPPVLDGAVLTEDPLQRLARGTGVPVPLVIGVNTREEELYGGKDGAREMLAQAYGARVEDALELYGGLDRAEEDPVLGDVLTQIAADLVYKCRAVAIARSGAESGAPTWLYQYGLPTADGRPPSHGSEIEPLFQLRRYAATGSPMQPYLVNFIRSGDPNREGLPRWPRYSAASREHLEFTPEGIRASRRLREPLCDWAWK